MKKAFLLLLLIGSYAANAQSLKEALFSGKLKNSPGMVIRKGDDLSKYIDTSSARKTATDENGLLKTATVKTETPAIGTVTPPTTAAAEPQKEASGSPSNTSVPVGNTTTPESTATTSTATDNPEADTAEMSEPVMAAAPAPAVKEKPKDNKALFKDYMNSLASTLKSEVLSNKKIKKGSYFVMVSYTIGTDGQVTITELYVDPKQELLQQQIKERLDQDPPQLNPEINSSGVARKVNRKYSFTLDKE